MRATNHPLNHRLVSHTVASQNAIILNYIILDYRLFVSMSAQTATIYLDSRASGVVDSHVTGLKSRQVPNEADGQPVLQTERYNLAYLNVIIITFSFSILVMNSGFRINYFIVRNLWPTA